MFRHYACKLASDNALLLAFLSIYHRCNGLIILETYTTSNCTLENDQLIPDFLEVKKEVTDDPEYSMYELSRKDIELTPIE